MVTVLALLSLATPPVEQNTDTALVRRVDSVFVQWSGPATPGCAVGVDRGGAPLLRRAYGLANLETGTPWTVETISESGSTAKQFTAAGIVLLALDGVLKLDDDISRWIPEVHGQGKRITIRQLLTHTSGLPDRYTLHEVQGRPAGEVDHDNAEVLDLVSRLRELNFDPGEDYEYSNTGLIVAATLLERASGKSLQAFSEARLFKPLGMQSTRWRTDHRTVVPGRASAYSGNRTAGFRNDHPFTRVVGSGGLLTSVGDSLKWEAALQSGSGVWGAVRDSLERVGVLNDRTELTYGLGVGVSRWRGVKAVSHTGSTGGYRAALSRYPEQNVAVALLCNLGSINPGQVAQRVAELVLGPALAAAQVDPAGIAAEPAALEAVVGAYHAPRTEQLLVLSVVRGALVDSAATNRVLIPIAAHKFQYRGSQRTLTVVPGTAGRPTRILSEAPNTRPVEYLAVARTRSDAAAYAGAYYSAELDTRIRVSARGDTLRLERGTRPPQRLMPLFQDGFSAGGTTLIRFEREGTKVTGLVLWAGRVRHLRFSRVTGDR